ncbi:DsbA family protein [Sesbania bispinosa]|nr:DsbA family protein [Sesbania bispinosa]
MSSNSNTSQVRVLGSSTSNPSYDWVLLEVLEKTSEYLTPESIRNFREEYDLESDLSNRANTEVEFLKSLKKKALTCSDIIDAEGDPSTLKRLLGTPTSTSAPIPHSPKRLRIEGSLDNISNPNANVQSTSEVNRPPSSERPPDKWWLYFREFESAKDAEVTSIFDRQFPLTDMVEGNLCKASNRARIQRVGLHNTAIMAQSMAARTFFLAHGLGHGIDVLGKENF